MRKTKTVRVVKQTKTDSKSLNIFLKYPSDAGWGESSQVGTQGWHQERKGEGP